MRYERGNLGRRWFAGIATVSTLGLSVPAIEAPLATAASTVRVLKIAAPPALATRSLKLSVKGATGRIDVYAGHTSRLARGDVVLARRARVRSGKITVRLSGRLAAGAWFLVACPAGSKKRCGASPAPTVVVPASVPAPPTVTASPGTGAVSGTSDASGLRLAATSGDGTRYTLVVPPGSLPDGTQVTMTPLGGIAGAGSAGSFVAGVQFAPSTPLFKGGALVVRPKAKLALAAARVATLGLDGQTLSLAPWRATRSAGGFGTRLGALEGVVLLRHGAPGRHVARTADAAPNLSAFYGSLLSGLADEMATGTLDDRDATSAMVSVLSDWHDDIISSEFEAAKSDDAAADKFIADLDAWAQEGALLLGDGHALVGGEDSFEETYDGMSKYFGHAMTHNNWELEQVLSYEATVIRLKYLRAQTRCANHDLTAFQQVLADNRQLTLTTGESRTDAELLQCLKFKVTFDSTMVEDHTAGATGTLTHEYVASSDVVLSSDGTFFSGATTGTYAQASGELTEPASCHNSPSTMHLDEVGGTGAAFSFDQLVLPAVQRAPTPGAQPSLAVTYASPVEHFQGTVDGCGTAPGKDQSFWAFDFRAGHAMSGTGTFTLDAANGSATVASKTYDQTMPLSGESVTEHTVIRVEHDPPPPPTE